MTFLAFQISYPNEHVGELMEQKTFTGIALVFCHLSEEIESELAKQEAGSVLHSLLLHLSCLICFPSSTTLISLSLQEFEYVAEQTAKAFRSSCGTHLLSSTKES